VAIRVVFRVLLSIRMSFIAIITHFSFLLLPVEKSITGLIRLGLNQLLSFL